MLMLFLLAILSQQPEDMPLTVMIHGSPPVPELYQLGMDTVRISDVSDLQERLLQWYLEEGYPFASAGFYFSSEDTLMVNAVPGRHAFLEDVIVEGMPGTRPGVFTRLLSVKPGDYYSREAVSRWVERIGRMEFVRSTGASRLLLGTGGNLVLVQEVEKGNAGHFAAAMDYNGDQVQGSGEVLFLNLAGTARELEISGKTTDWGGFDAYLRYREPWVMGIPLSLQLEISQDTPESSWVNREGNLTAIWDLDRTEISAGAGLWRGYPPDGSSQEYDYGLAGIAYSTMRPVVQGRSGLQVSLQARSGNRSGQDSSGVLTMASAVLRVDLFRGLWGFGGGMMAGGVMQGDWFPGLLRKLGGQATIRGYPENAFRAVRYALIRPEVSLGQTETRLYVFTDLAVVKTADDELSYPLGSGVGMRGVSGIFNADAAVGFPLREGLGSARLYLKLTASI